MRSLDIQDFDRVDGVLLYETTEANEVENVQIIPTGDDFADETGFVARSFGSDDELLDELGEYTISHEKIREMEIESQEKHMSQLLEKAIDEVEKYVHNIQEIQDGVISLDDLLEKDFTDTEK